MRRILLGVAVLAVLVGGLAGCRSRPEDHFVCVVAPCCGRDIPDSVTVGQASGPVEFVWILNTYCGSWKDIAVRYTRGGDRIEIWAILDADSVAKCVCPVEIKGQIDGLPSGTYRILFVFENRYADRIEVCGVAEIVVP